MPIFSVQKRYQIWAYTKAIRKRLQWKYGPSWSCTQNPWFIWNEMPWGLKQNKSHWGHHLGFLWAYVQQLHMHWRIKDSGPYVQRRYAHRVFRLPRVLVRQLGALWKKAAQSWALPPARPCPFYASKWCDSGSRGCGDAFCHCPAPGAIRACSISVYVVCFDEDSGHLFGLKLIKE